MRVSSNIINSFSILEPADTTRNRNYKRHSNHPSLVSEPFCRIHIHRKTDRNLPASVLLFDVRILGR
jgi:hypothetical protein